MYLYCCGTLYLDQAKEEYVMEYLLSTDCLTKKFKRQTAIDNISLHIRQSEIYGLIGKNGAGKTTFLKMISGLSKPTSGDITFFGYHGTERNNVISRIGVLEMYLCRLAPPRLH